MLRIQIICAYGDFTMAMSGLLTFLVSTLLRVTPKESHIGFALQCQTKKVATFSRNYFNLKEIMEGVIVEAVGIERFKSG